MTLYLVYTYTIVVNEEEETLFAVERNAYVLCVACLWMGGNKKKPIINILWKFLENVI